MQLQSQRFEDKVVEQVQDNVAIEQDTSLLLDLICLIENQLSYFLELTTIELDFDKLLYLLPVLISSGLKVPSLKCANQSSAGAVA